MKFGLFGINMGPLSDPDASVEVAQTAEAAAEDARKDEEPAVEDVAVDDEPGPVPDDEEAVAASAGMQVWAGPQV